MGQKGTTGWDVFLEVNGDVGSHRLSGASVAGDSSGEGRKSLVCLCAKEANQYSGEYCTAVWLQLPASYMHT
jgi:hypothetical protein